MLSNGDIKRIIENANKDGHVVNTLDIAYVILCMSIEDPAVAYRCIFGKDENFDSSYYIIYDNTASTNYLKQIVDVELEERKGQKSKVKDDITFEENKAFMLKLKRDTEEAMEDGNIPKKDGLTILKDIAVKLNDKFNVTSDYVEQVIVVNKKFNAVCECGREIYVPTKEDLMEKYNLIEKR